MDGDGVGMGVTHTNVLPRLGIGADFTRQSLHGTLVVNGVLTDWARGKKIRALAKAPLFSSSLPGGEVGSLTETRHIIPGCEGMVDKQSLGWGLTYKTYALCSLFPLREPLLLHDYPYSLHVPITELDNPKEAQI